MNRRAFLRRSTARPEASLHQPPAPLAISAGLGPYTAALDQATTAHLLRRTSFGASPERLAEHVGKSAPDVVRALVQAAVAAPLPEPPPWINDTPPGRNAPREERQAFQQQNRVNLRDLVADWFMRMAQDGLREKMALFWHNHFVTEVQTYRWAGIAYRYVTALRTHALGNFKDFVRAIGLDPAMLIYLNGIQNRAGAPNENYARELLELFTMGQFDTQGNENYTQNDIEEIARALTGWTLADTAYEVAFIPGRHDGGVKTFFGRTGTWGYDDVIDILFEERAVEIAAFVCGKLYREFVYAAPEPGLVEELAQVFLAHDFEIAPVVEALLTSAHFFDAQVAGAHIKSPAELLLGLILELEIAAGPDVFLFLNRVSEPLQQAILSPPNVAGWPGHHAWLNTTTFVARWNLIDQIIRLLERTDLLNFVGLAEKLHDPADPHAAFELPVALAEHLFSIAPDLLDLQVSNEPFAGDLVNNPIPPEIENGPPHQQTLAKMFLAGTPWYEWNLYSDGAPRVLSNYIQALKLLPEFQLA